MTQWMITANLAIGAASFVVTLIAIICTLMIRNISKKMRTFFLMLFAILILYIITSVACVISEYFLTAASLTKAELFFKSLFSSMLLPMITFYVINACQADIRKEPLTYVVFALWGMYLIMLISAQFTDILYYVTPDNVYHRGELYPMLLTPPALIMATNLAVIITYRKKLSVKQRRAFSIYLCLPLAAMIAQMFFYGLLLIEFATSVAVTLCFLFIVQDQVEKHMQQREENLRNQLNIKVLQMRPHFIYNILMSIYYLCEQDPKKAQQVTLDFSSYLRKNFTAVAKDEAVPFSEELEHARAYLAVEQVRFEDKIQVNYDISCIEFRIPPLTLQPIVENSVKYGVGTRQDPLKIDISTFKDNKLCIVRVDDNGPGYNGPENDEPHVALENIRERLRLMCRGQLKMQLREGGGTRVDIIIPQK